MILRLIYRFVITILGLFGLLLDGNGQAVADTLELENFLALAAQYSIDRQGAVLNRDTIQMGFSIFENSFKPQVSGYANIPNFQRTFSETIQPDGTIKFQPISYNNSFASLLATQRIASTGGLLFAQTNLQRFDDFDNNFQQYSGLPIRIGIQQPLFAFNPFKWQQQIQPLRLMEAEKRYNYDTEQIKYDAVFLFSDLLLANSELDIATANESSITALYDIAKERFELGKISERDLIQLELELVSAQRNRQSAEQSVRSFSIDLFTTLGMPAENRSIIPRLPSVEKKITVTEEQALNEFLTNRPELVANRITDLQAASRLERAQKENNFNMDITASVGFAGSAMNAEGVYTQARDEQRFQLQLNIPILDWGIRKQRRKIATVEKEFTQQQIAQNELELKASVQQTVQQFLQLQQDVQLAKRILELANKRYEISKESYLLGAIGLTELTLSQREKDQSARQYIQSLTQYWQTYYLLRLNTLFDFEKGEKI